MKTQKSKSVGIYFLMGLLLLQGISAVYGGASLVLDPSGSTLQMPLSLLEQSPFNDYVIPGVILLLVLGIFPLSVFYGLWRRRKWSWLGALMVSLALITWIGVEITMVGYHSDPPLQLVYGILGLLLLFITLLPSVKRTMHAS